MESSQLQSATGLRRENESMDDFEHLEVESVSSMKDNVNEKLVGKEQNVENSKSDTDSSTLVKAPDESRNSSDFYVLSKVQLANLPPTTPGELHDLTANTEIRKSSPADEMSSDLHGFLVENVNTGSKTDPKTVSKSLLAAEALGEGYGQFKETSEMNVDDLLHFESKPILDDVGHKIIDGKDKLQPSLHVKDDDDSFKDTIPDTSKTAENIPPFPREEIGMGDIYRDVLPEEKPSDKPTESLSEGTYISKYKTGIDDDDDDDDDEIYNLTASQDSSPIRMADKLEQYNIKPTHDTFLKSEQSAGVKDEYLENDELLKVVETVKDKSEQSTIQRTPSPIKAHISGFLDLPFDSWFIPEKLPRRVEQLVYWRNPKKSGIVLCLGLALLLSLTYCSLISVIAYLSLAVLVGCGSFRLYRAVLAAVNKTGEGHPFRVLLDTDFGVSSDRATSLVAQIIPPFNASVEELKRLFLVEDMLDSIKFGVMLWAMTYLGAIFNGLTLVTLAFVSAFTLPRLYENNKPQIDKNIELVRAKIAEITAKVQAFNPLSGAAAKKLAGAGSEDKKDN